LIAAHVSASSGSTRVPAGMRTPSAWYFERARTSMITGGRSDACCSTTSAGVMRGASCSPRPNSAEAVFSRSSSSTS
jgi:hypothetical protein